MYHGVSISDREKRKADRSVERIDLESWSRLDSREVSLATKTLV